MRRPAIVLCQQSVYLEILTEMQGIHLAKASDIRPPFTGSLRTKFAPEQVSHRPTRPPSNIVKAQMSELLGHTRILVTDGLRIQFRQCKMLVIMGHCHLA